MSTHRVEVATLPDGRGTLYVDGIDLSALVSAISIQTEAGHGTEMVLRLRKGLNLDFSGDAAVQLVRDLLIAQSACICTEVLPKPCEHGGGLEIDPECPMHGKELLP